MHTHMNDEIRSVSKAVIMGIDFHDFIDKANYLSDVEIAQEFGVTVRDIEVLRSRLRRS